MPSFASKIAIGITVLILAGATSVVRPVISQGVDSSRFDIALFGDQPYGADGIEMFPALLADINAADLAFAIHVGDIKNGSTLCNDEWYDFIFDAFQALRHPLIYVPGDNEWTDCHRENNGSYDSLDRLALVRRVFFPDNNSLGRRQIPLERQSATPAYALFRENVRWSHGDVLFVGLHVIGSNNNLGRNDENDVEYHARNAANLVWLRESFAMANSRGHRAVMVFMQANPWDGPADQRTGFVDFLRALESETVAFQRPVVLVHGDSHYFRIDRPAVSTRRLENLIRLEVFGEADNHWVRATVDPNDPNVFSFRPAIVEANRRP